MLAPFLFNPSNPCVQADNRQTTGIIYEQDYHRHTILRMR